MSTGGRPVALDKLRAKAYLLTKTDTHTAYELQVFRIRDAAEEHVNLTHREHALQTASHDVLD